MNEDHVATQEAAAKRDIGWGCEVQIKVVAKGGSYRGGIVDGQKSGLGQFEYKNGDRYEGQFLREPISRLWRIHFCQWRAVSRPSETPRTHYVLCFFRQSAAIINMSQALAQPVTGDGYDCCARVWCDVDWP